jgi:HTH-type transcriptional regulator, sugar sensing transcriptional regulator
MIILDIMYNDILEELGLTPNEAKIYMALLELKNGTIWDISTHAGIHRRNTYDAIHRLMYKGLAFQVLPKRNLTYAPVHPDKLKEYVEDKINSLEKGLPGMIKKYNKVNTSQFVNVYKGVGGLRNYIDLEISVGKDIYCLGGKGSWYDERVLDYVIRKAYRKYKEAGIKSYMIYDQEAGTRSDVVKYIGNNYKILPKKYSSNSSVDVFGDYVAIYSGMNVKNLEDDITITILKDKTLAQDFMKWWQFMWDMLPKVK